LPKQFFKELSLELQDEAIMKQIGSLGKVVERQLMSAQMVRNLSTLKTQLSLSDLSNLPAFSIFDSLILPAKHQDH
jgi:hypothetical protein